MNEFVSQKINSILNLNTTYALSSCISFVQNSGNYFADCCIKSQNGNNFYRFINNQIMPININDIYQYEPQVLIYELKNQNSNNYCYLQNTMNTNNNYNNNANSAQLSNSIYSTYPNNNNNQINNQFINNNINDMMN